MKFVYLHPTYVFSVLIIGLNLTCTIICILWICTRPTFYFYTLSKQDRTHAKWWNTCIASQHFVHSLRQFGMKKIPTRKIMDMTRCSLGKFLVVPTFVTRRLHICKDARDPRGERRNYLSRRLSCNFYKRPLSRHLGICILFSAPVFFQTIVFRVWVLDLERISAMYALGSWLGPSDEIRLYANNMQRIYTE